MATEGNTKVIHLKELGKIIEMNKRNEILSRYFERTSLLIDQANLYLKDFTCVVCGFEHFDITKTWTCPKCKESYDLSSTLRVDIAEELCKINTEIMKELYRNLEEQDLMMQNACEKGSCPLEGDCPLEAI